LQDIIGKGWRRPREPTPPTYKAWKASNGDLATQLENGLAKKTPSAQDMFKR
jgi:hypothetical protein|tara:strand:- start:251 stop:406 length:156 start_codon:yes stop_codon:yes gene_type:complete